MATDKLQDDLKKDLQSSSDKYNALLMSFIAPDSIVRKSPVSFDYATIKIQDLYKVESEVEDSRKNGNLPKQLHLIIQTPGGDLSTATKIAFYLQRNFQNNIIAFVPYEAASGGTMLCLSAKNIVMGETSNITPIDPQIPYKYGRISTNTYEQALGEFQKNFGKLKPEEIPSPYQQMANQFDPVIYKEMQKLSWDTANTAYTLLLKSQAPENPEQKSKLADTAINLSRSETWPHSHIIRMDEAIEIGLNISNDPENLELLRLYKRWVSAKLNEETDSHIIETIVPNIKNEKQTEKSNG